MVYIIFFKELNDKEEWELDYYTSNSQKAAEDRINIMLKEKDSYRNIRIFEAKELQLITQSIKLGQHET